MNTRSIPFAFSNGFILHTKPSINQKDLLKISKLAWKFFAEFFFCQTRERSVEWTWRKNEGRKELHDDHAYIWKNIESLNNLMLRAKDLQKTFYPPRGKPIVAVSNASFEVKPGEVFGLLGPNGAGKTTLLRILGTIIMPTSGRCWVNGTATDENPDEVRKNVGFLSGNTKLYQRLTAAEVLRYFGRLYSMTDKAISARTAEIVKMLDMEELLNRRCESLSTGQTQKVSIARVMLHDPQVLILDEPTLGLDILTSRAIINFILEAKARGHCIIFSTHYMTEAETLCDRVGLIHRGNLLAIGSKQAIYDQTDTDNLHDAFLELVDTYDETIA